MWRPPYDHPYPPPSHPHDPPRVLNRPAPPHVPPVNSRFPPEAHPQYPPPEASSHEHHMDHYNRRPMYRPPPPAHHRYDYGYAHPPPYPPPPHPYPAPPQRPHNYYGDGRAALDESISSALPVIPMMGGGCTCKKSKCLKLYCQCFSSSTTCGPKCKCQTCHNTTRHPEDVEEARKVIIDRNPAAFDHKVFPPNVHAPPPAPVASLTPSKMGCKCRRSFCLKKYCECFNHGAKCGASCRCVNCRNQPEADTSGGPYSQAQASNALSVPLTSTQSASYAEYHNDSHDTPENAPPDLPHADEPMALPRRLTELMSPSPPEQEDRMAIMAAVAMTELLGCKRSASRNDDETTEIKRRRLRQRTEEERPSEERPVVSAASSASSNASTPELTQPSPRPSPRASPVSLPPFAGHYYPPYSSPPFRPHPKAYEETTRLCGLPKSLSFRKICSKCGKTRGEHGELGFGHRCVYQDCGKCGAGVQMHIQANSPMGILCTLTEQAGATPGAARAYERKIHDLAVRAELQQKIQAKRLVKG